MAKPTAPSTFKRSSERGSDEKWLRRWAFGNAQAEDRALAAYEEIGFTQSAASLVVHQPTADELLGKVA